MEFVAAPIHLVYHHSSCRQETDQSLRCDPNLPARPTAPYHHSCKRSTAHLHRTKHPEASDVCALLSLPCCASIIALKLTVVCEILHPSILFARKISQAFFLFADALFLVDFYGAGPSSHTALCGLAGHRRRALVHAAACLSGRAASKGRKCRHTECCPFGGSCRSRINRRWRRATRRRRECHPGRQSLRWRGQPVRWY